jgi:prepilin-type N-terminal cleavage/methylation domain-containing protein
MIGRSARKGFSLIELLVAMVILVIISSFGIGISSRAYRRGSIDAERDTLRGVLEKARSQALANIGEAAHGLAVTEDEYVVFRGNSYDDRDEDFDEVIPRTAGLVVDGPAEVIFEPIEGTVDSAVTFTVQGEVKSITVEVNEEGRVNW